MACPSRVPRLGWLGSPLAPGFVSLRMAEGYDDNTWKPAGYSKAGRCGPSIAPVEGAPDAVTSVQHVAVDHRGTHVLVAEELLNSTDVIHIFEQVSGEGVF